MKIIDEKCSKNISNHWVNNEFLLETFLIEIVLIRWWTTNIDRSNSQKIDDDNKQIPSVNAYFYRSKIKSNRIDATLNEVRSDWETLKNHWETRWNGSTNRSKRKRDIDEELVEFVLLSIFWRIYLKNRLMIIDLFYKKKRSTNISSCQIFLQLTMNHSLF